ncbi:unnamed protein product [Adineta steineri]|uniref:ENTH domain-containing protein n=1 Tax=Adineta steineri TaxID=433720 RepID=A0A813QK53_9BILA|nr:unnamed protein product [Adineta steineri]CAF0768201.1 unnamed protein product [Adineta steineri]
MLARGVRNVIYNYTDAQRKVRSATSNDAWGPSPALMHEIADLTDNIVAYAEIMPIVWKRLNDHGKNWRHVYKSLVLLDHLIKYGNERVSQQCKENIFAIQTLKDFQYVEDQKDQGYNVREKAKQLIALLKDDERLRNERRKAQDGRERYVRQAMGMDSNGSVTYGRTTTSSMRRNSIEGSDPYGGASYLSGQNANQYPSTNRSTSYNDSLHAASGGKNFGQPSTQEEEQLQMQIALAESQREAEDEERRRRNDDLKLKIALERSVNEASPDATNPQLFDFNTNPQHADSAYYNTPYLPATTASNIGWDAVHNRSSTHPGLSTAINLPSAPSSYLLDSSDRYYNIIVEEQKKRQNDPWALESNNRTTATTASNDPWQPPQMSNSQTVSWGNDNGITKHNDTALSINISDPWGLGTADSRPIATAASSTTTKAIDNELSDFFGSGATITPSYDQQQQQQHTPSNPWNIPPAMSRSSTSPLNTNLSMSGGNNGNLLYPMIGSGNNPNPISSSPISPSLLSTSRKTPESFLGDKFSTLVNLDQLVTESKNTNPFGSTPARVQNPFSSATRPPTLDQLTSSNNVPFTSGSTLPPPLIPSSFNNNTNNNTNINSNNPFL